MKHRMILLLCAVTMALNGCTSAKPTASVTEPAAEVNTELTAQPAIEFVTQTTAEPATQPEPTVKASEAAPVLIETDTQETTSIRRDYPDDTLYMGEFLDSVVLEPNLEIEKIEDGRYLVQIGIYRLAFLSDGDGKMTADGMIFTATDPSGNPISGIIQVKDGIATVTFTDSSWEYLPNGSVFQYTKSSDTPNILKDTTDNAETPADKITDASSPLP